MATNIFKYWSDGLGARHLTTVVRTEGRAFANKSCLQGQVFDQLFSNAQGLPGGLLGEKGGILASGIDSYIMHRIDIYRALKTSRLAAE